MESVQNIEQKLRELNGGSVAGPWIPGQGFHALISFEFPENDGREGANFKIDQGYPVKYFVNTQTGEIRLYAAMSFRIARNSDAS